MSVIIRLQNLPWSANALDIREFFKGLSIPEGGVHIVGGELGDAFIAFSTDEDARLAMQKTGSSLKSIQVTLLLSSRSEMQKVIEAARQQAMALQGFASPPVIPTQSTSTPQTQSQPQSQTQSQPPPIQISQPPPPTLHQQMGAHTPYQMHGHPPNMDGPDHPPHLPPHMVPPPKQQMAQPGSSMSMPPTSTPPNIPNLPPPPIKPGDSQAAANSSSTSEKKDDKKSSSSSSSSRRDSKSRRRRTKSRSRSRSRSRDRDRRRRHRSRTRSRSRDRGSRSRRRSRSRDRDRGRDRTRDRDRDKDRGSRSGRDRSERNSLDKNDGSIGIVDMTKESSCPPSGIGSDGIPGLGEIPSMKGPLPMSLAEPLKNSPIQTPSQSPAPTYNIAPPMAQPFHPSKMFTPPPIGYGALNPPDPMLATKFNDPMETEMVDDNPIVIDGPEGMHDLRGMRNNMPQGSGDPQRMDGKGGLLGDGPPTQPYGNFQGRGMPYRGNEGFGFGNGPMSRPPPSDMDYMDPRGGRGDGSSRQRDPRDRGFRGEMDMRDGRGKDDERSSRDDPNSWEGSGSKRERSSRWESVDKRDSMGDPGDWHSRVRRDGWGDRDDDKWGGRNDTWKDEFGRRDERDAYDDPYGYNYRGRGGRGMERGRMNRGGRGFNPRFGGYPGFPEENGDDLYGFRGGYRGRGGFRGRGGPFGARDSGTDWTEETCSVEIRNVPTGSSYRAIRDFFHGIFVPKTGIKLISDEHGNRIDVALLQFSSPRDAQRALRCTGNYIFDNKIEVVLTSEAHYETAIDANQLKMHPNNRPQSLIDNRPWPDSTCVCVSGIPTTCTENEIAQFLGQYNIQDMVIEHDKGRCFVRLSTAEASHHAASTLNNSSNNGGLMVEVCPPDAMAAVSRAKDSSQANGQAEKDKKKTEEKKPEKVPEEIPKHQPMGADLLTDSVVMKGVPKDTSEANIRDFFSDEGLVPERIHFCDPDGDGARQVYVIFPLIEDARKAVGKSQQQLCKVKVNVELIAKPLVMATMGMPFDPLELIRKGQKSGETPFNAKPESLTNSEKEESSKEASQNNHDSQEDSKDMGNQEEEASSLTAGQDQLQGFATPGLVGQMPYRGAMMPQFPGGPRPFRPFMARMPMPIPGMRGMADPNFGRMRGSLPLLRDPIESPTTGAEVMGTAITPEEFGTPGCVVSLGNVPYRATTEDILSFFREFPELRPENIIRRYNEFNQPTADARVCFRTPQDAQRAVQTLNRTYLIGRQVFLSMLTE